MDSELINPSDAALVQNAKPWLSRPNVVGLSVGPKTIGGRSTRHRAIVVHVVEKKPPAALGPDDFPVPRDVAVHVAAPGGLPRAVSMPTDVVEVGELRTEHAVSARGGSEIAADNVKLTGTLGVNVVWAGRYRLLASNHVISENGNLGAEVRRLDADPGRPGEPVGTVDGYLPVACHPSPVTPFPLYNRQDLAWCDLDRTAGSPEIAGIGTPTGLRAPVAGEAIRMIGKQTGRVRTATVVSTALAVRVEWPTVGAGTWAWFDSMIQLDAAITQPGDSGSAYVALSDGKVVGLHVGGGAYSFGCQLPPY
jgi:hypothetical protein